jgi:hypothetical protein
MRRYRSYSASPTRTTQSKFPLSKLLSNCSSVPGGRVGFMPRKMREFLGLKLAWNLRK